MSESLFTTDDKHSDHSAKQQNDKFQFRIGIHYNKILTKEIKTAAQQLEILSSPTSY